MSVVNGTGTEGGTSSYQGLLDRLSSFKWTDPEGLEPDQITAWSAEQQQQMMVINAAMSVINAMYDNTKGWISQVSN